MRRIRVSVSIMLLSNAFVLAQTSVDLKTQAKNVDFSGANTTKPSKTGTVLPATCSVGETFFKTSAAAGQNLFGCTTLNVWTQLIGVGAHAGSHAANGADPVSPASIGAQPALGYAPENAASRGAANGYAPLDENARVPEGNLPTDPFFQSVNAGDGSRSGEIQLFEKAAEGSYYLSWLAPDKLNSTIRYLMPATTPAPGQFFQIGGAPDVNQVVPLILDNHLQRPSLGSSALTETYLNEGVTGTRLNYLAVLSGSGKTVLSPGTAGSGILGVCQSGCGISGSAEIAIRGRAICTFDTATTEGHYVQADRSAGKCHDAGAMMPSGAGTVIGQVLETGAAGDHEIHLGVGPDLMAGAATSLQGRTVASTAPVDGQVLQWSASHADWEPTSVAVGGVSSVDAAGGVQTTGGAPITGAGSIRGAELVNRQTGGSYTLADSDRGKLVVLANAGAVTLTIPQPGAAGQFPSGWYADVQYGGGSSATLVPSAATIDGASSLQLGANQGIRIVSDGSQYMTLRGTAAAAQGGGGSYYQAIRGMSGLGNGDNTGAQTGRAVAQLGAFLSAADDSSNGWTQINADFLDMRTYALQDHFLNYTSAGASIGELGWATATFGGTNTLGKSGASVWPWLGGTRLSAGSTNPVAGNGISLTLAHNSGAPNLGELGINANWGIAIAFRVNATANLRFRAGTGNQPTSLQPASAFGIRYDTSAAYGDSHLNFFVKPASGAEVAIDTGISDTSPHVFVMRSTTPGTIRFSLDGSPEKTACASGCDVTAVIPILGQDPFFQLATDTTATKTADIFEFRFQARLSTQTANRR
jgi:hypothetical protein